MAQKKAQISQMCENCVKVCEGMCESVLKYVQSISWLKDILLDTQPVEIATKMSGKAQIMLKYASV